MNNKKLTAILLSMSLVVPTVLTGCGVGATTAIQAFEKEKGFTQTGYVEGNEVDLNTKIEGEIAKIYVEEGQKIKAGNVIAEVDSTMVKAKRDQIKAKAEQAKEAIGLTQETITSKLQQAEGAYQYAVASLEKAKKGVIAAGQTIEKAKAAFEYEKKMYNRVKALYEQGAVPENNLDGQKAKLVEAEQNYKLALEGKKVAEQDVKLAEAGVQQAQGAIAEAKASQGKVTVAKHQYEEAKAGLAEINAALEDTKIIAPKDGTITALNVEVGELVSSGMPIATVADLGHIEVNVKVYETDLQYVSLEQEIDVKFASTGEKVFKGKVKRISQKPTFATKKAVNSDETDMLAYEVKVEVTDVEKEPIFPGMTAYVLFPKQK